MDGVPRQDERERVLDAVRALFLGMERKDGALLRSVLLPETRVLSVPDLEGPEEWVDGEEFVRRVLETEEHLLERMFDPLVRVDGPLAHIWAPYDFWRDGEFSHCGTDSFNLIRTLDGWRIVAIAYTLHPEALCPERDPPEFPPGTP